MGELKKGVSVVMTLLFVGLFLAGAAAAGSLAFPRHAKRLSEILQTEGGQLRAKLAETYHNARERLAPEPSLHGRGADGHLRAGPGATARVQGTPPSRPAGQTAPRNDSAPGQQLYGLNDTGSVLSPGGTLGTPSLSAGAQAGGGQEAAVAPAVPAKPDKPAATPIPGSLWLLGSGLAALFVAVRVWR